MSLAFYKEKMKSLTPQHKHKKLMHHLNYRFYNLKCIVDHCDKYNEPYAKYLVDPLYDTRRYNGPIDILLYDYLLKVPKL